MEQERRRREEQSRRDKAKAKEQAEAAARAQADAMAAEAAACREKKKVQQPKPMRKRGSKGAEEDDAEGELAHGVVLEAAGLCHWELGEVRPSSWFRCTCSFVWAGQHC